jgi:L-glutamine-phosphate cytidylyltransferase
MEAVILAAGVGKRLLPLTKKCPKCLVDINGETILQRIVTSCFAFGIKDFKVAVGHGREAMYLAKKQLENKLPITITLVENLNYDTTNTGVSLSIALGTVKGDSIIVNGDIVFDPKILKEIMRQKTTAIVVDNVKTLSQESFKVQTVDNKIVLMGKDIPLNQANGEFTGISLIKKQDINKFKSILRKMTEKDKNSYYDFAFQKLASLQPISFVFTNGLKWTEIDTREDLDSALKLTREHHL